MNPELIKLLILEYVVQRWMAPGPALLDELTKDLSLAEAIERLDRYALDNELPDLLTPTWTGVDWAALKRRKAIVRCIRELARVLK